MHIITVSACQSHGLAITLLCHPHTHLCQMFELRNNPSGEIRVSTIPENPGTINLHLTSADAHKIGELKENIHSLKSQIEMVRSYMHMELL